MHQVNKETLQAKTSDFIYEEGKLDLQMMDKMDELLVSLRVNHCMKQQCSLNLLVFQEFSS